MADNKLSDLDKAAAAKGPVFARYMYLKERAIPGLDGKYSLNPAEVLETPPARLAKIQQLIVLMGIEEAKDKIRRNPKEQVGIPPSMGQMVEHADIRKQLELGGTQSVFGLFGGSDTKVKANMIEEKKKLQGQIDGLRALDPEDRTDKILRVVLKEELQAELADAGKGPDALLDTRLELSKKHIRSLLDQDGVGQKIVEAVESAIPISSSTSPQKTAPSKGELGAFARPSTGAMQPGTASTITY